MTLNRGLYSLIHVHSSWRASTSVATTVNSTEFAVCTIVEVRGCSWAGVEKYELSRLRRFFAFPTYITRRSGSRNLLTPAEVGIDPVAGRSLEGSGIGTGIEV